METVQERLYQVRQQIAAAALRVGRKPEEITLVAVSKTHPASAIAAAREAGQRIFGESRLQEAAPKVAELPSDLEWHFIGHLQKNKIRKILPLFALLHGVDTLDLALDVNRIAGELGLRPRILLEVNVSGEASKFGFDPLVLQSQWSELLQLPHLDIQGLMTMAPYSDDPEAARPYFRQLRQLRDQWASQTGRPLGTLSMGMSGDFGIAIEEGSTMVRVGTSIFGSRQPVQ